MRGYEVTYCMREPGAPRDSQVVWFWDGKRRYRPARVTDRTPDKLVFDWADRTTLIERIELWSEAPPGMKVVTVMRVAHGEQRELPLDSRPEIDVPPVGGNSAAIDG